MTSLTDVAKAVLKGQTQLQEGAIPSVSKDGDAADRDAKRTTPNAATLRPKSKSADGPKKLEGTVQDLGAAVVNPTDSNPDATVGITKDTSKSSKSKVPGEKAKSLAEDEPVVADAGKEVVAEEKPSGTKTADRIRALAESLRKAKKEAEALAEQEETEEEPEFEISEEVRAFVQQKIEEGLSEEEIFAALDEEFEIQEETDDELPAEVKAFIDTKIEEGLTLEEVQKAVSEKFVVESEKTETPEVVAEEEEETKVDMTEHVEALFNGETLSEDFKSKAKTILETAVQQKLAEEKKKIEEQCANMLAEEVERIHEEIASNVDDYLNYVVEDWAAANAIAIESGLRTELTEEFISGLRQLFAENWIDIPAEKVSVVEELATKTQEIEARLNEEIAKNVELTKQLHESKKEDIVSEAASSLTQVQGEKLKTLCEGIEFSSLDEFKQKVATIRESYFSSGVKTNLNPVEEHDEENKVVISEEVSGRMSQYVKSLGKKLPN